MNTRNQFRYILLIGTVATLIDFRIASKDGFNMMNIDSNTDDNSQCDGYIKSPTNFKMPFTVDLDSDIPKLNYNEKTEMVSISKIGEGAFQVEGEFGFLTLADVRYDVEYIIFKSPSEHRVNNRQLPLEMQIYHLSELTNEHLVSSVLFEYNKKSDKPNTQLERFGFSKGNKELGELDLTTVQAPGPTHDYKYNKAKLNLNWFFANHGVWIFYDGNGTDFRCKKSRWYVSFQSMNVIKGQLANFNGNKKPYKAIPNLRKAPVEKISHDLSNNLAEMIAGMERQRTKFEKMGINRWKGVRSEEKKNQKKRQRQLDLSHEMCIDLDLKYHDSDIEAQQLQTEYKYAYFKWALRKKICKALNKDLMNSSDKSAVSELEAKYEKCIHENKAVETDMKKIQEKTIAEDTKREGLLLEKERACKIFTEMAKEQDDSFRERLEKDWKMAIDVRKSTYPKIEVFKPPTKDEISVPELKIVPPGRLEPLPKNLQNIKNPLTNQPIVDEIEEPDTQSQNTDSENNSNDDKLLESLKKDILDESDNINVVSGEQNSNDGNIAEKPTNSEEASNDDISSNLPMPKALPMPKSNKKKDSKKDKKGDSKNKKNEPKNKDEKDDSNKKNEPKNKDKKGDSKDKPKNKDKKGDSENKKDKPKNKDKKGDSKNKKNETKNKDKKSLKDKKSKKKTDKPKSDKKKSSNDKKSKKKADKSKNSNKKSPKNKKSDKKNSKNKKSSDDKKSKKNKSKKKTKSKKDSKDSKNDKKKGSDKKDKVENQLKDNSKKSKDTKNSKEDKNNEDPEKNLDDKVKDLKNTISEQSKLKEASSNQSNNTDDPNSDQSDQSNNTKNNSNPSKSSNSSSLVEDRESLINSNPQTNGPGPKSSTQLSSNVQPISDNALPPKLNTSVSSIDNITPLSDNRTESKSDKQPSENDLDPINGSQLKDNGTVTKICDEAYFLYENVDKSTFGEVPIKSVMPWEKRLINKKEIMLIDVPKDQVPNPPIRPGQSAMIYSVFYYTENLSCKNKYKKLNAQTSLAQIELQNGTSTNSIQEIIQGIKEDIVPYVPVLIETTFPWEPELPTLVVKAYNTDNNLVEPILIKRHFGEDTPIDKAELQKLKKKQENAENDQDYNISKVTGRPIVSEPIYFHRIWPTLNLPDGIVPIDSISAWHGVKETEKIQNILPPNPPKTSKFRYVLFFYVRTNYTYDKHPATGKDIKPLVPIFILLDKDSNWKKDLAPEFQNVPFDNKVKDDNLKSIKLQLMYMPKKIDEALKNKSLLETPEGGVDEKNFFQSPEKFRQNMVKYQGLNNPEYFNKVMKRYEALLKNNSFDQKELLLAAKMEMTGVLVNEDKEYRDFVKKNNAKRQKRGSREGNNPGMQIVKYHKVCKKYELDVIMNNTQGSRPEFMQNSLQGPKDEKKCIEWSIEPILEKKIDDQNMFTKNEDSLLDSLKNFNEKHNPIQNLFEQRCREKFYLVQNTRGKDRINKKVIQECKKMLEKEKKIDPEQVLINIEPGAIDYTENLMANELTFRDMNSSDDLNNKYSSGFSYNSEGDNMTDNQLFDQNDSDSDLDEDSNPENTGENPLKNQSVVSSDIKKQRSNSGQFNIDDQTTLSQKLRLAQEITNGNRFNLDFQSNTDDLEEATSKRQAKLQKIKYLLDKSKVLLSQESVSKD